MEQFISNANIKNNTLKKSIFLKKNKNRLFLAGCVCQVLALLHASQTGSVSESRKSRRVSRHSGQHKSGTLLLFLNGNELHSFYLFIYLVIIGYRNQYIWINNKQWVLLNVIT